VIEIDAQDSTKETDIEIEKHKAEEKEIDIDGVKLC